ncbi:pentapeptide repeat-containing protein [Candidatus Peregrinibacteria bacterium]|nr:pentapeptide repeat-containing protein [Candidatus Peregrinibacteria bacterium]
MIYTVEKLEELQHRWTTPKGKALIKAIKVGRCYLSPVLFRQEVRNFPGIKDEEVEDGIDLRGAPMAGFDFRVPILEDDDGYSENVAILSNIHFEGTILKHCNFENGKIHDCSFENAELEHCNFENATVNNCNFQEANCLGVNLHNSKLINCNFSDATIRDISLASVVIDQKSTFGKKLRSEKEDNYHFASMEYKQIKEMYKNSSLHGEADEYHFREMVAKRKTISIKSPKRWFNFFFGDLLCKYGTSFNRVLFWAAIVILISAASHTVQNSLYFHNTPTKVGFLDSLYFSIVTFTTLGYGDYHAIGLMRFIAAGEAFIGATLLSLFTVIVARTIIRD